MSKILILEKIDRGLLPSTKPVQVWAGSGAGKTCDGCEGSILATDIEFELVFRDGPPIRLHRQCWDIWFEATGDDTLRTATTSRADAG